MKFKSWLGVSLIVLVILFFAAWIILSPFALIWAVNTLFGTTVPYTIWTWLSVEMLWLVLTALFRKAGCGV